MKYIAYYRVSTSDQGRSGLGLDAQKKTVQDYINADKRRTLIGEFKDIESGKNDNRPQLNKAIEVSKRNGATLLIAKLDRLSRNVQFIFMLRDSKADFKAIDLPDMNTLTVGIFATMAQHEREIISQRTKDALAVLKARGKKLGTPSNLTKKARLKGRAVRIENSMTDANNRKAFEMVKYMRKDGLTYNAIAERLNELGYVTRRNCQFNPMQVQRLVLKYA